LEVPGLTKICQRGAHETKRRYILAEEEMAEKDELLNEFG